MDYKKLFEHRNSSDLLVFSRKQELSQSNIIYVNFDNSEQLMEEYDSRYGTNFNEEFKSNKTEEFLKYFLLHCFGGIYIINNVEYNDISQISIYCKNRNIDIFESSDLMFVDRPHLGELDRWIQSKHTNTESEHIEHSHKIVNTPLSTKAYLKLVKKDITSDSNHSELKQLMFWTLGVSIISFIWNILKR